MSTKNTSTTATPSPTSKISGTTGSSAYEKEEENLKRMLTLRLQRLLVRNGSDQLTYEKFVPHHLRGKGESIYRRNVKANLHEMVQRYESGGSGKRKRELFDQTAMRTAFTMKEKQHGQHALLDNSLNAFASRASRENVYNPIRLVKLEGIVEGLKIQQERLIRDYKRSLSNKTSSLHYMSKPTSAANSTELAHEVALFEEEKRKLEEERREQQKLVKRQEEKRRRAEAESRVRERERKLELARQQEMQRRLSVERSEREEAQRHVPPRQRAQLGLARLYEPIFKALWDMEFPSLNGTNPFRVVIDENNCSFHGVPDYCHVIEKPMNLTWIREKVNARSYITLKEFHSDVTLMIKNALLYNSDPANVYHLAAKEMNRKFKSLFKETLENLQQGKKK